MHRPHPEPRVNCLAILALLAAVVSCASVLAATAVRAVDAPATSGVIDVNGYRFDPRIGEPLIPSDLRSDDTADPALRLVQFTGPVEEAWKDGLRHLGARIFGYLPENSFVVLMDAAASDAARALPYVRWVGLYHAAYRISPEIGHMTFKDPSRARDPQRTLLVLVADDLFSVMTAARSLGTVMELIDDPAQPAFVVRVEPSRVPALAALPGVLWVEEKPETFILNNTTKWVVQSNVSHLVPIWDRGIYGEGQIVCEMDSGLDYNSCWFRETNDDPPGPSHRKVIDYKSWGGNPYDGCVIGHGTHVAGTVVGDQSYINHGVIDYNGMAYKAKIAVQDVGSDDTNSCTQGTLNVPASLTAAFSDAYSLGARVHTNSWGSTSHAYNSMCVNVDSFMWQHPDFLILFANGNDGPTGATVSSPATSKDCVSVGASQQAPDQELIADYSSRGPTADGRWKPTVTAPGGPTYIVSANNHNGNPPAPTCATQGYPFTGTSMATPAVAGCALLVRDYFAKGFYPLGDSGGTALAPSAALVKAMLVNAARDMGTPNQPNNTEGWGRILLDDGLYFSGDTRELHVEDERVGLATGEQASYRYQVDSASEPLEVTLVWTDYAGAPNANPTLVNNLDLTVQSPTGETYLGNVYSGGQSVTGGTADILNVEESARRESPELGVWTITINARNIPQGGHQPFALVTTGSFANWPGTSGVGEAGPLADVRLEPARPNPTSGGVAFGLTLPAAAKVHLAIYDAAGRQIALLAEGTIAAGAHRFVWDGRTSKGAEAASGTYFCRLETERAAITRKLTVLR